MLQTCEICDERIPKSIQERLDDLAGGDDLVIHAECVEAGMEVKHRVGKFVVAAWLRQTD